MAIKYWELEDAPLREKLKNPNVKEISKIYFENENRAYRSLRNVIPGKTLRDILSFTGVGRRYFAMVRKGIRKDLYDMRKRSRRLDEFS
jgi:hypothetical protein